MSVVCFFNDTATTEIYTLSLHDALPIYAVDERAERVRRPRTLGAAECRPCGRGARDHGRAGARSEEHTSELQSRQYLVCRLLLETKHCAALALVALTRILSACAESASIL